jgi:hypothetical protein
MTTLALISLALATACRAVAELQQHGKLRWSKDLYGFWGHESYVRKYKIITSADSQGNEFNFYYPSDKPTPNNWYYKFFKIYHREHFPLSATFLVFLTDGMHLMQFIYHILISLAVALLTDISYFIVIWPGVILVHATVYKLLSR